MKLLVTGGAGFIGSNFIHYWLERHPDDMVVNLDALTYAGNLATLKTVEGNSRYSFVHGDITDSLVVEKAMNGVDMVVHFAAETHVDRSVLDPATFLRTNVIGTQVLLEASLQHSVSRFHHISTDEVFGSLNKSGSEKFNENTPYHPNSPYSAAKASSDMLVRAYNTTFGLPITISNCSNNYGPYQFPEKLIPLCILNAQEDKALPVYGDGSNIRDWIHVLDHVRAIELVLLHGKVGETYCVGGDQERSNIEVIKGILKILNKPESLIQYVKDRPGHDERYAIDNTKIHNELGYSPNFTFESGLKETVVWYLNNKEWWQPIISKEYLTYYQQQYGTR
jgi:dTDP-glucose 4,6-dehydratase